MYFALAPHLGTFGGAVPSALNLSSHPPIAGSGAGPTDFQSPLHPAPIGAL